jgi:uncharacterized SAM-binding protein YcdF (DUF218 family)
LAALAGLAVGAVAAYNASPRLLTIDSGRSSAGALVVLGGDPRGRPARAAELFAAGEAPLVVVSGNGDWNETESALKSRGVPAANIVVESRSRTTKENAELSVALLRRAGLTNAIIVTSWFHSRRALNCFRHAAPEMRFYSRPCYAGWNRAAWSRNGVGIHIRAEYVKLLGYWVWYGIAPF